MKFILKGLVFCMSLISFVWAAEKPSAKKIIAKTSSVTSSADSESHKDHSEHEEHNSTKESPVVHEDHEDHEDHGDETDSANHDSHDSKGEHKDHAEENTQVGPDKGITEASEKDGIKISQAAERNFDIERIKVHSSGPILISKKAIVTSGDEVNLYRFRNGYYKRIDFSIANKVGDQISVTSKELKAGDEIVIRGMGYLRVAEIAAFGGAPEGHSH